MHIMSYFQYIINYYLNVYFKKYNFNVNHENLNYLVIYYSCIKTILENILKL